MKCLLVHGINAVKTAVCMYVSSGSLSDPHVYSSGRGYGIDGLAHFCEHMTLSKEIINPGEGSHLVMKNGCTDEDYT